MVQNLFYYFILSVFTPFSLRMPNDVQLLASPTKLNRSFDVPTVLIRNFFLVSLFSLITVQKNYLLFFSQNALQCSIPHVLNQIESKFLLICRNFSSPVMQTASSVVAMPSFSSLLPFARLDVNPGW